MRCYNDAYVQIIVALGGIGLLIVILWDGFEAMVLPRRVTRKLRLARAFYRFTWWIWSAVVGRITSGRRRQAWLGVYGPLSMLLLMVVWASGLIAGFGLLFWSLRAPFGSSAGFLTTLYVSGTNFITLGLGDITPQTPSARLLTVIEAGTGFGFLALVIGYLPVLYQSFSRRELNITLLDARAGSPSSAGELLRRHARGGGMQHLNDFLREWERWSADLLESHVSYPVLSYYRSQHDNQSWLAALTTVLDACTLVIEAIQDAQIWQAQLTFAMSRHAVVDLAQILRTPPRPPHPDRLRSEELARLEATLAGAGLHLRAGAANGIAELRAMYEPYVNALAEYLLLELPPWTRVAHTVDNWRTSAWGRVSTSLPLVSGSDPTHDEHMG